MLERGSFSDKIIDWYGRNKREFPWRTTRNPYKIWLSEIILQQTRVNQGLPYYLEFIKQFPTIDHLANADITTILRTWQGLGYYSRARNLHKCAQTIVRDYNGVFPDSYAELQKLPGVGPYTAAAIASLAFNERVGVVDGNVFRVLSRVFGIKDNIRSGKGIKKFQMIANELAPERNIDLYNQGIMDFGSLVCTPTSPKCSSCTFAMECIANQESAQAALPVKSKKSKAVVIHFTYFVFFSQGKIWMTKRGQGIWDSLYEFFLIERKTEDPAKELSGIIKGPYGLKGPTSIKHLLSHRTILATFYLVEFNGQTAFNIPEDTGKFYTLNEIEELPKPILIDGYFQDTFF